MSNVGGSLLFHGIIINTIGDDVSEETKAQLSSLKSIEGIEYYDFGKEGIVSYYGYNEEIQIPYDIFYNPDNEKLISSALGVSISEFNNIQNDLQTSNKKSALGNSEFKYLWQEASGNIYIDKGSGRVDVDNDDRYYKKYELLRQFGFITQEQAQEIEKAARDSQITNPDGIEQAHYGTISSYSLTNSMEDVAEFVAECYVNPELIGYLIRGYIKWI